MNVQAVDPLSEARSCLAGECGLCGNGLEHTFVDLGMWPLGESLLAPAQLDAMDFPILMRPPLAPGRVHPHTVPLLPARPTAVRGLSPVIGTNHGVLGSR